MAETERGLGEWATYAGPDGSFVVRRDRQAIEDMIAMLRVLQRRAPADTLDRPEEVERHG